jgi:hypothetical protein
VEKRFGGESRPREEDGDNPTDGPQRGQRECGTATTRLGETARWDPPGGKNGKVGLALRNLARGVDEKGEEMGRIRGSQPKLGFSLFFFLFIFFSLSFQIQVVFKFNSNSCDQLLQFILATFRYTNSGGIYLHILFIYSYPLSLSLLHISRIPSWV